MNNNQKYFKFLNEQKGKKPAAAAPPPLPLHEVSSQNSFFCYGTVNITNEKSKGMKSDEFEEITQRLENICVQIDTLALDRKSDTDILLDQMEYFSDKVKILEKFVKSEMSKPIQITNVKMSDRLNIDSQPSKDNDANQRNAIPIISPRLRTDERFYFTDEPNDNDSIHYKIKAREQPNRTVVPKIVENIESKIESQMKNSKNGYDQQLQFLDEYDY